MNNEGLHQRNRVWNVRSHDLSRFRPLRSRDRNHARSSRRFNGRRRNARSDRDLRRKLNPDTDHRHNRQRNRKVSLAAVAAVRAKGRNPRDSEE